MLTTLRYSLHRVPRHMYEWKCENGIKHLVISLDFTCLKSGHYCLLSLWGCIKYYLYKKKQTVINQVEYCFAASRTSTCWISVDVKEEMKQQLKLSWALVSFSRFCLLLFNRNVSHCIYVKSVFILNAHHCIYVKSVFILNVHHCIYGKSVFILNVHHFIYVKSLFILNVNHCVYVTSLFILNVTHRVCVKSVFILKVTHCVCVTSLFIPKVNHCACV